MYEISIYIDGESFTSRESSIHSNETLHSGQSGNINICDEPFTCGICGNEIKGPASKRLFEAIDNELCFKCLSIRERKIKSMSTRLAKLREKQKKLNQEILSLEYEVFKL